MRTRLSCILTPVVSSALVFISPVHAQTDAEGTGRAEIPGVRLGDHLLDPGIVEGMDAVLAREIELRLATTARDRRNAGRWEIPGPRARGLAKSGELYASNRNGDPRMGVGFPEPVSFHGAWFAGQGGKTVWAGGVRMIGFLDGHRVAETDWFGPLTAEPQWFAAEFDNVDRVEVQSIPVYQGAGWYALDDLTYTPRREDAARIVIDFEDGHGKQTLTGTGFAGLTWENGRGDFASGEGVPAPIREDDLEKPPAAGGDDGPPPSPLGPGARAPFLDRTHQGVIRGDASQFSFPPDTSGAVGPNHYLEVVNRVFAVFDKGTGIRLVEFSLGAFQPGTSGDPRVLFDHFEQRWVVMSTNFSDRIYLAYSATDDPTGTWYKTSYVASTGNDSSCWPDYPTMGLDANGIYISAAMFGGGCNKTIWAIDKAPLLDSPPSLGTITAFRDLSDQAIQPAMTYGDSGGVYFVSTTGGSSGSSIRVRQLVGNIVAPSLVEIGIATVPFHSSAPDAPAPGATVPIETGDRRLFNAVYRDGSIYCGHNVSFNGRAACRWYEILANVPTLVQSGTISDSERHFYYPAISANMNGDIVVGFSGSSEDEYPSAYFAGRRDFETPGLMSEPVLYRVGAGSHNLVDGFGRNRFGDYSLTTVDPEDDTTFWTVQEYVHSNDTWGTAMAVLTYTPPPPFNDRCEDALPTPNGATTFTTVNAMLDGPAEATCGDVAADVWYRVQAAEAGMLTVSLCDADFDTWLGIYDLLCPDAPGLLIACNDDACGVQSEITVAAEALQIFTIRIGGREGSTGSGTMMVTLESAPPCAADLDGDGSVSTQDLLVLLSGWGNDGVGADLAAPSDVIDATDLLELLASWGDCPTS